MPLALQHCNASMPYIWRAWGFCKLERFQYRSPSACINTCTLQPTTFKHPTWTRSMIVLMCNTEKNEDELSSHIALHWKNICFYFVCIAVCTSTYTSGPYSVEDLLEASFPLGKPDFLWNLLSHSMKSVISFIPFPFNPLPLAERKSIER